MASRVGLHVSRQAENPQNTLLGLHAIPFRSVLDVGANEGQFARLARRWFPLATLYCFEPIPNAYEKLVRWSSADGNVVTMQVALGDVRETRYINIHSEHTPSSSLLETTNRSHELYPETARQCRVEVCVERLDDVIAQLPHSPLDDVLLKLDVQGFEARVLRGAHQILRKARACVTEVCLEELYQGQSGFSEVLALMGAGGLRYAGNLSQVYAPDGHVIYLDAVFVR